MERGLQENMLLWVINLKMNWYFILYFHHLIIYLYQPSNDHVIFCIDFVRTSSFGREGCDRKIFFKNTWNQPQKTSYIPTHTKPITIRFIDIWSFIISNHLPSTIYHLMSLVGYFSSHFPEEWWLWEGFRVGCGECGGVGWILTWIHSHVSYHLSSFYYHEIHLISSSSFSIFDWGLGWDVETFQFVSLTSSTKSKLRF